VARLPAFLKEEVRINGRHGSNPKGDVPIRKTIPACMKH
jgi:hypothetical protein